MSRLAVLLAAGAALAVAANCAKPEPAAPKPSPAAVFAGDPAAVKRGKSLFIGMCGAYCHSLRGGARGDIPDLFDCAWKNGGSDEEIFRSISQGVPGTRMDPFSGVLPDGDTDIWKLVAFLRANSSCAKL